jgi:hypothetical protein
MGSCLLVSELSLQVFEFFFPLERLCRNDENAAFVILNEVKNLMHSIRYTAQILRLPPQNDIATQPLTGED